MAWGMINVQRKPVITTAPWHLWYLHLPSVTSDQVKNQNDIISMYASAPETLPRLVSRPCRVLAANGLSKWPIAQPLCNCDQISHGSSNPIRSCLCVLRLQRSMMDACLRKHQSLALMQVVSWMTRWLLAGVAHLPCSVWYHISDGSHMRVYGGRRRGWWCQLVAVKARGTVFCRI